MAQQIEIKARAAAFRGQGVRDHRFLVEGREVRVWDEVAGYYTRCHNLGKAAQRRIVALAVEQL